ncbi:VCBS domain-containing protein [Massilia sp. B-10]|nr:VCBS domain-containing protein [Massilia sp. B-10]
MELHRFVRAPGICRRDQLQRRVHGHQRGWYDQHDHRQHPRHERRRRHQHRDCQSDRDQLGPGCFRHSDHLGRRQRHHLRGLSTIAGSYGSIALQANGQWQYTASSAHNEFVGGTNYSDVFTVTSTDGTTSTITVNILGTNDAAVISTTTANLTETNSVLAASGILTISDVDSAATFVA